MIDTPKVGNLMVIDDDETDHLLYQRVIKRSNLVDETVFFTLAEDALAYLRRADRAAQINCFYHFVDDISSIPTNCFFAQACNYARNIRNSNFAGQKSMGYEGAA